MGKSAFHDRLSLKDGLQRKLCLAIDAQVDALAVGGEIRGKVENHTEEEILIDKIVIKS